MFIFVESTLIFTESCVETECGCIADIDLLGVSPFGEIEERNRKPHVACKPALYVVSWAPVYY